MKSIRLGITTEAYHDAEQAASREVPIEPREIRLVGWYDSDRHTGGPTEVCAGEPLECARDYASSHGAEYEVVTDRYEFFFGPTPADAAQLDPEALIEVHRGLERDEFENQQGG